MLDDAGRALALQIGVTKGSHLELRALRAQLVMLSEAYLTHRRGGVTTHRHEVTPSELVDDAHTGSKLAA
jgi:hypothetical protein